MISIDMTQDIREYEPKLFNLVTIRQLILLVLGAVIAVPIVIYLPIKDITIRCLLATIAMSPFIVAGWVPIFGMRMELFLWQVIKSSLLVPKVRIYQSEGVIDYLSGDSVILPPAESSKKTKVIRTKKYQGRK